MGILSDLISAPSTAADAIARSAAPNRDFDAADIKGVDDMKFVALHGQLTGDSLDDVLAIYDPVASASEDGPWVFQIPTVLVQRLASMNGAELASVAERWSRAEEFTLDGWTPADVHEALASICSMATQAQDRGHSLFLRTSL